MLPEHSFNFTSDLGPDLSHHFDPGYTVYSPVSPGPGMWQPSVMKQDAAYLQSTGANTFMMDTMERSPGHPGQGGFTLGDLGESSMNNPIYFFCRSTLVKNKPQKLEF